MLPLQHRKLDSAINGAAAVICSVHLRNNMSLLLLLLLLRQQLLVYAITLLLLLQLSYCLLCRRLINLRNDTSLLLVLVYDITLLLLLCRRLIQ
jgi:hypothetical protein